MKICPQCKNEKELTEYYFLKYKNNYSYWCKECIRKRQREYNKTEKEKLRKQRYNKEYREKNREKLNKKRREYNYKNSNQKPMSKNKKCSQFLGIYVAENVLSKVFKNVEKMPWTNPKFDFICNRGYKIDVKSSSLSFNRANPYWHFNIYKNVIADYFLCIGFDNRNNLNPLKLWLIPSSKVNKKVTITMTNTKKGLKKWKEFEILEKLEDVKNICTLFKSKDDD